MCINVSIRRTQHSLLRRHLTEESGGEKKFGEKIFFSKPIHRLKPIERPAEEAKHNICSSYVYAYAHQRFRCLCLCLFHCVNQALLGAVYMM